MQQVTFQQNAASPHHNLNTSSSKSLVDPGNSPTGFWKHWRVTVLLVLEAQVHLASIGPMEVLADWRVTPSKLMYRTIKWVPALCLTGGPDILYVVLWYIFANTKRLNSLIAKSIWGPSLLWIDTCGAFVAQTGIICTFATFMKSQGKLRSASPKYVCLLAMVIYNFSIGSHPDLQTIDEVRPPIGLRL
jgi:hypothetical protein